MAAPPDEYQLEIAQTRRHLAGLKAEEAPAPVIAEFEAQLRNLQSLYRAALDTLAAPDPRLPRALRELGFGDWTLQNVYAFVYDAAMAEEEDGRDLANVITHTDYAGSLLAALDQPG